MDWKFVVVLIFSLLVAVFTMQNAEAVDVKFLTFEFTQVSEALVILISAAAGALIALLLGAIRWVRDKTKMMGAKKSIAGLETQIKQLKIMLETEIAKHTLPVIEEKQEEPTPETESNLQTISHESEALAEQTQGDEKGDEPAAKRKWYQI